jgi:hypothetical protein
MDGYETEKCMRSDLRHKTAAVGVQKGKLIFYYNFNRNASWNHLDPGADGVSHKNIN